MFKILELFLVCFNILYSLREYLKLRCHLEKDIAIAEKCWLSCNELFVDLALLCSCCCNAVRSYTDTAVVSFHQDF